MMTLLKFFYNFYQGINLTQPGLPNLLLLLTALVKFTSLADAQICSNHLVIDSIDTKKVLRNFGEFNDYTGTILDEYNSNGYADEPGVEALKILAFPLVASQGSSDIATGFVESIKNAAEVARLVRNRDVGGYRINEWQDTVASSFTELTRGERDIFIGYVGILLARTTPRALDKILENVRQAYREFYLQLERYRTCLLDANSPQYIAIAMAMVAERIDFNIKDLLDRFIAFSSTDFELVGRAIQRLIATTLPDQSLYTNFNDDIRNRIFLPMTSEDWHAALSFIQGYLALFVNIPASDRRIEVVADQRWRLMRKQTAGGIQFTLDFEDDSATASVDEKTADDALVDYIDRFSGRGIWYTEYEPGIPIIYPIPLSRYLQLDVEHLRLKAAYARSYLEHRIAFEAYSRKLIPWLRDLSNYFETLKVKNPPAHLGRDIWQFWISEFQSDIRDAISNLAIYYVERQICSTANSAVSVTTYGRSNSNIAWITQTKKLGTREKRTYWEALPGAAGSPLSQRWRMRSYSNQNNEDYEDGEWTGSISWSGPAENLNLIIADVKWPVSDKKYIRNSSK